jgi:hypothetical protein
MSTGLTMRINDADKEKRMNMIDEELEKFVIKPENIIRANNKEYEMIDKKK